MQKEKVQIIQKKNYQLLIPPNNLKKKAGSGGIPSTLVEQGQNLIQENDIDFIPFAREYLEEIKKNFTNMKEAQTKVKQERSRNKITENIMQLKAHGGMFGYPIMSRISDTTLSFLEMTNTVNEDLYQIIKAHNRSIETIITVGLKGDGGPEGTALLKELQEATLRYQKKYK